MEISKKVKVVRNLKKSQKITKKIIFSLKTYNFLKRKKNKKKSILYLRRLSLIRALQLVLFPFHQDSPRT